MPKEERLAKGKLAREWAISKFSTEVTGKFLEKFIDDAPFTDFDFESLVWKPRNPNYEIPKINDDSEWLIHIYKNILNMEVDAQNDGHKYWMNQLANKVPRSNVEDFFRKTAKQENDFCARIS